MNKYGYHLFSEDYMNLVQIEDFDAYFVNGEEDQAYPVWWKNDFYEA